MLFEIVVVVLLFFGSCLYFAYFITHSHRQPKTRTPADYAMKYEDMTFPSLRF